MARNLKFLILLPLAAFLTVNCYAKGVESKSSNYKNSKEKSASFYEKYADDYETQAGLLEEKAYKYPEKSSYYKSLAQNYRSCAREKRRMAEAYRTGNNQLLDDAQNKYGALCEARKSLETGVSSKNKTGYKSGKSDSEYKKNWEKEKFQEYYKK